MEGKQRHYESRRYA